VQSGSTGDVTDLLSFYALPSTIIGNKQVRLEAWPGRLEALFHLGN
jgi:hypothetical protein